MMADRVELAFRKAALDLIPAGSHVVAAVSGGGDSVALLHLLSRHSRGRSLEITVAHLDHALRRGSARDRRFVAGMAADLSLAFVSDRRPVPELRGKGESLEEAARRVRRAFLMETVRKTGADLVATGHTLDDQAETVVMRLVRGAGPAALAGMSAMGPGPVVRPLLGISRSELRAYLGRREIPFREDPSNRNLRFDRNRTRQVVLPLLAETLNPRAAHQIVKAAALLREDADFLDDLARKAYGRLRRRRPGGRPTIPVRDLVRPGPVARRIVRLALEEVGVDPRRVATRHIDAVLALARGEGGKRVHLPGRHEATRVADRVILR